MSNKDTWSDKLKEEIVNEIKDRWYDVSWRFPTDDYIPEFIAGFRDGFKTGAQEYAIKWQSAEQWKSEASLLLNPLLEWGQAQKDMPLGINITSEILRRAKLWQAAEAKAQRYENALKEILKWELASGAIINVNHLDILKDIMQTTNNALTNKTSI